MKNKSNTNQNRETTQNHESSTDDTIPAYISHIEKQKYSIKKAGPLAEILFITSYPPRECGIATYSQDLLKALKNKFSNSFSVKICALESGDTNREYPDEVKYVLKTSMADSYRKLADEINKDNLIKIVVIQHEFGFYSKQEQSFIRFLSDLAKPVVIAFHTVLPEPDTKLKSIVRSIAAESESLVVMTHNSADILINEYGIQKEKVAVIAHGTHLVPHLSREFLKNKYGLKGRRVLTTFGLLSSGKSIETTLNALPSIIKKNPDVLFLIIGKTHPEVLKVEGEKYRISLEEIVKTNKISDHVKFINSYLTLPHLLEYLQLTDIYLFTTKDPNQAVSGTFAYAMSCGCPIISTPIPHAKEVLTKDTGIIIDFLNSEQLADSVLRLLNDASLRISIRVNTLQKIVSTAWENSAVKHTMLFKKLAGENFILEYNLPPINLNHIKQMTTDTGIIQFSRINQPDLCSGYTLDDNARAMVAMCNHFGVTHEKNSIWYINKYLSFIKFCQQPQGDFLNFVNIDNKFTAQNRETINLDDANGRAVWALGYLISQKELLPDKIVAESLSIMRKAIPHIESIQSPRAMAYAIKGLYFYQKRIKSVAVSALVKTLADRLVQMYEHEAGEKWQWFEDSLTYANSILPEAMLYSWLLTGDGIYKKIALSSFDFLLSVTFNENGIEVISNKTWLKKGQVPTHFGEQPIDVAYTILTLSEFFNAFADNEYYSKMITAFNWFLGNNRLHQVIYNPCTGGCYDGLEETHVNLNQGAESTISYLLARLTIEKFNKKSNIKNNGNHRLIPQGKNVPTEKVLVLADAESVPGLKVKKKYHGTLKNRYND